MKKKNRLNRMRHANLTRLVAHRLRRGKSAYVGRPNRFRHMR